MSKTKKSLKEYKNFLSQYRKINWFNLFFFIFDLIIFILVFAGFLTTICLNELSQKEEKIVSYIVLGLSFYILIKFTVTNFFYSNIYFLKLNIYKKSIEIDSIEIEKNEKIDFVPFWFLVILITINIISTIIINFQADTVFENQPVISACISTMASVLLIPSFSAILNKITEVKKPVVNNYTNLLKQQFVSFKDLFKSCKPGENFEFVYFSDLTLQSKRGIFIIDSTKKNKKINDFNHEIIEIYCKIWAKYYDFLMLTKNQNIKSRSAYSLEREFDKIFINFLEW
ncbi:hypothetical protein SSABA_v1c04620 [Spiroplasma sabaudiense Ar-1343]|uniref:Transmembrane protein n=1 Tax=Spiroplasma sabaudiense Ar-1343 TaxID=1276257 RepID=W6AJH4_9MOLU|nr:hypothetical protein [Spiroplasma sabaudiense]AHI53869.1 hypothetical protein SSABA_v1c04620 [Spiroplasma sabaudiense Ar-1343]